MKQSSMLRRLMAKADPRNKLVAAVDRLTENVNMRLDGLHEASDNQSRDENARLDRVIEAITRQSSATNIRLDKLLAVLGGRAVGGSVGSTPALSSADRFRSAKSKPGAEWLSAKSPDPTPLPRWSGNSGRKETANGTRVTVQPNALQLYQPLLDALEPWRGPVPQGFIVDFLGILTDANFRTLFGVDPVKSGGTFTATSVPKMQGANGEWWFETVNWFEAARDARNGFVMITLGANYGAQAVGAHRVLQIVNPMPCKLVAVEPVPENYLWVRKHFRDNGIDPDAHWLVPAAISDSNQPVFFPVGAPGSGAQNCMSTDSLEERNELANELIARGEASEVLRNLMLYNTTGIIKDVLPDKELTGEIELLSAVTLQDLLSPFELVDYVEADIQQSEARVFPPFLDLLRKKVRRIHIGTHGAGTHNMLHNAFSKNGWEVIFSYAPENSYDSPLGRFDLNDGILTVRNPDL